MNETSQNHIMNETSQNHMMNETSQNNSNNGKLESYDIMTTMGNKSVDLNSNDFESYKEMIKLIPLPTTDYCRNGNFGSMTDLGEYEKKQLQICTYPDTQLIQNKILGFTPIITGFVKKTFRGNHFISEFRRAYLNQHEMDIIGILKKIIGFEKLTPSEKMFLLKRVYGLQIIDNGQAYIMYKFGLYPRRMTSTDINYENFISILRQTLFFILFKTPHRDLKPENIIFDGDNLMLLDLDNIILQSYSGISQVNTKYYNEHNLKLCVQSNKDIDIIVCKEIFNQEFKSRVLIMSILRNIKSLIKMICGEDLIIEIDVDDIYYKKDKKEQNNDIDQDN
jgi:hypothetical protein